MYSNSIAWCLFLLWTTIVSARRPPLDHISAGNYIIRSCGYRAADVAGLLTRTSALLDHALGSTSFSNPVYNAFFYDADPNAVDAVLRAIKAGSNVALPRRQDSLDGSGTARPTIICATPTDRQFKGYMDRCKSEHVQALYIQDTPYVYLCPIFLGMRATPPPKLCSSVIAGGRALSGGLMAYSQYTILVKELSRFYLQGGALKPAVTDVTAAFKLGPKDSVRNPQNYAFFVGNVVADCTQFPTVRPAPDERELLEVGDGDTSDIVQLEPGCPSDSIQAIDGLCRPTA